MCAQRKLRSAWASIHADQSSLCAQWVAKGQNFHHADSEDDWVDAQADLSLRWAHSHFVGFVMSRLIKLWFVYSYWLMNLTSSSPSFFDIGLRINLAASRNTLTVLQLLCVLLILYLANVRLANSFFVQKNAPHLQQYYNYYDFPLMFLALYIFLVQSPEGVSLFEAL